MAENENFTELLDKLDGSGSDNEFLKLNGVGGCASEVAHSS
jgi:hypothetical protein